VRTAPLHYHLEPYQAKSGKRWRAVVRVPLAGGGSRRETTSWRGLQREAKADGDALLEALAAPVQSSETVAELLERWMRDYCATEVAETTRHHYRQAIDHHIVNVVVRDDVELGTICAADLTPDDVAEWQAFLLAKGRHDGQGLAPKSVRDYRGALGGAYAWAVALRSLPANPVTAVKAPRLPRAHVQPPGVAEVQAYLALLEGTRYHLPVVIAAATGMRRGEVLGLRWSDVDLAAGTVRVHEQVRQAGSEAKRAATKTAAGYREIPAAPPLVPVIAEAKRKAQASAMLAGLSWSDSAPVCRPMKPDDLTKGLRATLLRRHVAPLHMHALRHMVASEMLASGAGILEVQAQLGHKDSATTLGIYGHLLPGALSDAAKRYGQAWDAAAKKLAASSQHCFDTESAAVVDLGAAREARKPA
jgi:integrase